MILAVLSQYLEIYNGWKEIFNWCNDPYYKSYQCLYWVQIVRQLLVRDIAFERQKFNQVSDSSSLEPLVLSCLQMYVWYLIHCLHWQVADLAWIMFWSVEFLLSYGPWTNKIIIHSVFCTFLIHNYALSLHSVLFSMDFFW